MHIYIYNKRQIYIQGANMIYTDDMLNIISSFISFYITIIFSFYATFLFFICSICREMQFSVQKRKYLFWEKNTSTQGNQDNAGNILFQCHFVCGKDYLF